MNTRQKIQIAGAITLLLCLLPLPYGFYAIVRIVTTVISGYLAYVYYSKKRSELAITFLIIAIIFQPFFKFGLGREVWLVVDVAVAILLLVLAIRRK